MKGLAALLFIFLAHHRHLVAGERFCGIDQDDAENTCWQPCSTDDDCCASFQRCFEAGNSCGSSDLSGANHNFCGVSWCDAAYGCGTPCPETTECPEGQSCYADVPCDSDSPASVAPLLPERPVVSTPQFCGSSASSAASDCWQPCPRGDSDCCFGLLCFDTSTTTTIEATTTQATTTEATTTTRGTMTQATTTEVTTTTQATTTEATTTAPDLLDLRATGADSEGACTNSDYSGSNHFFCGSSWCDAAYSCDRACPGGTNEECPNDQYCYADVSCSGGGQRPSVQFQSVEKPPDVGRPPSIYSKYCGTSFEDANQQCWQPCRDDDDCCGGQTCYSEVTTCLYPDNVGADHYFCGTDFCDAAFTCPLPCPSGFDAQCPDGQKCFANTPCNAKIRSETADTLDYGLPVQMLRFIRQYRPDDPDLGQGPTTTSAAPDPRKFGLLFGTCLICLFAR